MSARRQSSTTSLSKYARANSPDLSNHSLDFCNAFWGIGDGGVDVLFARMRGAARTVAELRTYWKERSAIEEDYAKRMAKLAKMSLGRDEIGELRNSLDTLRLETDKQSGYHQNLAKQIREDLETPTTNFNARQIQHKKNFQAAIEKKFRTKQQQEAHVAQAGDKYKSDCLRINSYTAQASLMQGKELEKIHIKLERAQQTVQANERDFANFAKNLQITVAEWEQDWKVFCDSCQDQEEERMEFMKDTMWAYANAVSTVCVSDDESCEKMRLALEQMEPDKDMENFVREYGTGDAIPDPPAFVNYSTTEAVPSGSSRVTSRPAQFPRSTQRYIPPRQPPPPPEEPFVNTAGVGAIGRKGTVESIGDVVPPSRSLTQSRASTRGQTQTNGNTSANGQVNSSQHQSTYQGSSRSQNDPSAEPIDPTAETMLKVGNSVYKVDPTNDPQQQQGSSRGVIAAVQNDAIGAPEDPLLKTMAELRNAASNTSRNNSSDSRGQNPVSRRNTVKGGTSLSPPSSSKNLTNTISNNPPATRDYRNSAEMVVGSLPGSSRPASPNPPTAALMQPPRQNVSPALTNQPVESVVMDYGRSLPGENKSISRSNTRQSVNMGATGPNLNQGQGLNLARPVSREGHLGIGAHGQNGNKSRSTSPVPHPGPGLDRRNSRVSPAASASGPAINRGGSIAQRTTSPNSVGIALDPTGKVVNDTMADMYNRQQSQQQQQQQQSQYNQPHVAPRNQNRLSSYGVANNNNIPTQQSPYGGAHPPPSVYQPPSQPLHGYAQPPVPVQQQFNQAVYTQPPPSHFPPPPPTQQPVYQPQPQISKYIGSAMNGAHLSRGPSLTGSYNNQLVSPPHPYGTGGRTPSPQPPPQPQIPPTGQFTEDGRGVLFYVKALYDYSATIEEEFDFQSGDIIAVTATPEDGWWSGELLDEARRQPGRHVFPSNFVCLF